MRREVVEIFNGVTTFPDPDVGAIDFTGEESLTRQSEAESADINAIVGRFVRTGYLPPNQMQAMFADVSELGDFRNALELVGRAEDAFAQLEPRVRSRFDNDPAKFLDFFNDPDNVAELRELGLVEPEKALVPPAEPAA